jgi:hypothetical protein
MNHSLKEMSMRGTILPAACAALWLGVVLPVCANDHPNQPATQAAPRVVQTSRLIGATVLAAKTQEKVGQITDVLLDPQGGEGTFVILDAEIPASGHAMLVVPYRALEIRVSAADQRQTVSLDLRPERLRDAPHVGSNASQAIQNPQFLEQARNFYQAKTYTAARPIETPPSLPPATVSSAMPPPCPTTPPDPWAGWPQDLIDFYNE